MKKLLVFLGLVVSAAIVHAEMISSSAIGNDPAKEKLCAKRAKGKPVPFVIDSRYVKRARSSHPDSTFIAIDGMSPQLVECYQREGIGKYEPASMSPEGNHWHLPRPQQFEPGINTREGIDMAGKVCLEAAPAKIKRPNYDHSNYSLVTEVSKGSPKYRPGISIAGVKAKRYDIVVTGTSFYRTNAPDMKAVNFTCLLSPMLEVKSISLK